ncbi:NAD(P)H-dependent oxidoreductase [Chitinophaga alhagiae]|uniref:NAD(P)H-dependent oxidoreductase n=1 Tax=Chitinophaga alhagiae TaxID=2203219 RepID=A0ABM6WA96_9BACT|nr:NADPH-dependent FMN reductase [Chitinophaga alhagiae]AWO00801.1 NAD(P)H-dependent oxidoreductase [Chitinophaga alhagiae]
MSTPVHIVGLTGSLRKGSYNTSLLKTAMELLPEGVTAEIADFSNVPLYNADLDVGTRPEPVRAFREVLAGAQAILIVSPEYNYSIPGGLKNAIDWASRGTDAPLLHKPVALMGATQGLWGTVRMQLAFKPVFQFLDMKQVLKPEVMIAQAQGKFDAEGRLTDEKARDLVARLLEALRDLTIQLHK